MARHLVDRAACALISRSERMGPQAGPAGGLRGGTPGGESQIGNRHGHDRHDRMPPVRLPARRPDAGEHVPGQGRALLRAGRRAPGGLEGEGPLPVPQVLCRGGPPLDRGVFPRRVFCGVWPGNSL